MGVTGDVSGSVTGENSEAGWKRSLAALEEAAGAAGRRGPPPLHLWNPPDRGDSHIEILRDGVWRHEGTPFTRESLVRLFSTILRKEADGLTYLVTPGEKLRVRVEDAAFLAVRADRLESPEGPAVVFTTNVGDVVAAGPDHPIRVAHEGAEPRPYVRVRGDLEARILRAPFYEMADWAEERDGRLVLESRGACFDLGAA
ncbi:MAG: DUF1285 domain-containing protein [Hyphomonadaceae bacterium]